MVARTESNRRRQPFQGRYANAQAV